MSAGSTASPPGRNWSLATATVRNVIEGPEASWERNTLAFPFPQPSVSHWLGSAGTQVTWQPGKAAVSSPPETQSRAREGKEWI